MTKRKKRRKNAPDLSIYPLDNQWKGKDEVPIPLLPHPHVLGLIGAIGGGKTTVLINLLINPDMYYEFFHEVYVFSKNINLDSKFKENIKIPDKRIKTKYAESDIQEIIDRQTKDIEEKGKDKSKRILIYVDDMIGDNEMFPPNKKTKMVELLLSIRHFNGSIWIASQKLTYIPKVFRTQMRGVILFETEDLGELEAIIEAFGGLIGRKAFKWIYFYAANKDHFSFLFINFLLPRNQRYSRNFDIIPPEIVRYAQQITGQNEFESGLDMATMLGDTLSTQQPTQAPQGRLRRGANPEVNGNEASEHVGNAPRPPGLRRD